MSKPNNRKTESIDRFRFHLFRSELLCTEIIEPEIIEVVNRIGHYSGWTGQKQMIFPELYYYSLR